VEVGTEDGVDIQVIIGQGGFADVGAHIVHQDAQAAESFPGIAHDEAAAFGGGDIRLQQVEPRGKQAAILLKLFQVVHSPGHGDHPCPQGQHFQAYRAPDAAACAGNQRGLSLKVPSVLFHAVWVQNNS